MLALNFNKSSFVVWDMGKKILGDKNFLTKIFFYKIRVNMKFIGFAGAINVNLKGFLKSATFIKNSPDFGPKVSGHPMYEAQMWAWPRLRDLKIIQNTYFRRLLQYRTCRTVLKKSNLGY